MSGIPASVLRDIEEELSHPLFFGIPLGPTLNDSLLIEFAWGHGDWRRRARWLNRARSARHRRLPRRSREGPVSVPSGRILTTLLTSTPRLNEIILPVLAELDESSYAVLHGDSDGASPVSPGIPQVVWDQIMTYDLKGWRAEYRRCLPEWERRLRDISRRFDLPKGARELLTLNLVVASQNVAGCLEFLERSRPAVIVTEYDRNALWSCLVLAARRLGIPSVTLTHGVFERDALGFSPVLADTILCWGEVDRSKLLAAHEAAEKIRIVGCPRLSRDLAVTREEGRSRLALDHEVPVVMYATTTAEPHRLEGAELFCAAIERMSGVAGVVRLHPAEKIEVYAPVARRYPHIRFSVNSEATLDESLAAADIVVACWSGVGSDALIKRRPLAVLNPDPALRGPDWDLVERAGCPHARTAGELATILERILHDESFREQRANAAERYVADFCDAFGNESARRIADIVKQIADTSIPSTDY